MSSDYRERDCPKCGTETEVGEVQTADIRHCTSDECNWCVEVSGGIL